MFSRSGPYAAILVLIVAGTLLVHGLLIARIGLSHPDEVIATGVLERLRSSDSLDTNWRLADLPAGFKSNQYNFSGYLLTLYAASRVVDALPAAARPFDRLRGVRLFSALCTAAAVLVAAFVAALLAGRAAGVLAALLTALSPSLAMDGFYARPDALLVLLSLLLLLVFLRRERLGTAWIALAGFLVGFLVSIKISSLVYGLLLVPAVAWPGRGISGKGGLIAIVSLVAGFAAGAPGALAHPAEFLEGVRYLANQYANDFGPHGLGPDSTVAERLGFAATWLVQTWGLAIAFTVVGVVVLARQRRWEALFGFLPYALTVAYFMATPVFFERNLAPGLAAFAVLAAVGFVGISDFAISRWPGRPGTVASVLICVAILAVPMFVTAKLALAMVTRYDVRAEILRLAREHRRDVVVAGWLRPSWSTLPVRDTPCDPPIVHVDHAGDRKSLAWIDEAKSMGWIEIHHHDSRFAGFVPSTFHTYVSGNVVWLIKPRPDPPGPPPECAEVRWDWR